MYIFTEREIRACVRLDLDVVGVVEQAFAHLAEAKVTTPPIMRVDIPESHGEVDVKSAYIKGQETFAIKISSGFFQNHALGLPTGSGMMTLISAKTGVPVAVLLDNGYLTDVRTAAAGAVAAKHLANPDVRVAGVIGTGLQARYQAQALHLVRPYEALLVYGRTSSRAEDFAREMQDSLGVPVTVAHSAKAVVSECDVLVTTTPSRAPVVEGAWIHEGQHITAMGSDAEHKQELAPDVLYKADLLACDLLSQCLRLGEIHHAVERGEIDEHGVVELGDVVTGKRSGRVAEAQITVCDLTGTGVQDTAIAQLAFSRLRERGFGIQLDSAKG
ncbi:cyclodeaminase [Alicyclobacillus fastidiosus]|uniref:Cyclodeaminase n=1 Tax=Alicyclobacillus fastidiosus TaxID=392011 RepID=A0ABY6ZCT7_9BACL|nr:cyclodeaminase [Alicyclobacillus fastidiosus]WAH39935.1 cyclodeaminase [Alicyclobacillus fastidiosus]GMA61215.1 cyclodeaminase [Alicyclobacillus fastidiosus]